jgi:peptidoglycan-associated lipoprotein
MTSPKRRHAWGSGLAALLVLLVVTDACSRKRPPETDVTTDTGADTTATVRPGEPERAEDTMADRLEAARGTIAERIFFDFNRSEIRPDAREVLARKADVLNQFPEIAIRIEGHADERGTVEYNLALGEQRAQAAKAYLVALGIDASRVDTISYGEQRPVDAGHDELSWAINRRAHFLVRTR